MKELTEDWISTAEGLRPPSLARVRLVQQLKVRLQARGIGEPDLAPVSDAKARCRGNQPVDSLRGFFTPTEVGATEREDAIGQGEVPVALDRLARVRHGLLIPVGEQTGQGERESGVVNERLKRAEMNGLLGMLDGLVVSPA